MARVTWCQRATHSLVLEMCKLSYSKQECQDLPSRHGAWQGGNIALGDPGCRAMLEGLLREVHGSTADLTHLALTQLGRIILTTCNAFLCRVLVNYQRMGAT